MLKWECDVCGKLIEDGVGSGRATVHSIDVCLACERKVCAQQIGPGKPPLTLSDIAHNLILASFRDMIA